MNKCLPLRLEISWLPCDTRQTFNYYYTWYYLLILANFVLNIIIIYDTYSKMFEIIYLFTSWEFPMPETPYKICVPFMIHHQDLYTHRVHNTTLWLSRRSWQNQWNFYAAVNLLTSIVSFAKKKHYFCCVRLLRFHMILAAKKLSYVSTSIYFAFQPHPATTGTAYQSHYN